MALIETGLPGWLQPPKVSTGNLYTEYTVEKVLERLVTGESLSAICRDDDMPTAGTWYRWMMKNPTLETRYHLAKAIGADAIVDENKPIADGQLPTMGAGFPDDVQRDKLRVETRFKLAAVQNPRRYGPRQTNVLEGGETPVALAAVNTMSPYEKAARVIMIMREGLREPESTT